MRRAALLLPLGLAACVPATRPPPARPMPPPAAAPTLVVPPPVRDWQDVPLTPGTWTYATTPGGSAATFGVAGAAPLATISCDRASRIVMLARPDAGAAALTIRTSYGERSFPPAAAGSAAASWPAADTFLDRIAFSRGRFSLGAPGAATLYLPAWAEPARVIEDCRG